MPPARLSKRRLFGLDRSGPAPPQTGVDAPWRPWTIPNAIGFTRAALIPLFLVFEYSSHTGVDAAAGICFFLAGAGDYLDGITARVTGQYSRLGAALDPFIDRLLVLAGGVACWSYELLPRWAIATLLAREVLMLAAGQAWVHGGRALRISWVGRIAVGPTMFGIWLELIGVHAVGEGFFFAGLALAWVAAVGYLRRGFATQTSSSS
ncbi:MAG: CDP-alcohol phosphatidyltransferase family protein [Solirubrobacteraceae bacterium]